MKYSAILPVLHIAQLYKPNILITNELWQIDVSIRNCLFYRRYS